MDKVIHAGLYAPLGLLLQRALGLRRLGAAALAGALVGLGWGCFDEWLQSFAPGRRPDWVDVVADVLGAGGGAAVGWLLRLGRPRPAEPGYH